MSPYNHHDFFMNWPYCCPVLYSWGARRVSKSLAQSQTGRDGTPAEVGFKPRPFASGVCALIHSTLKISYKMQCRVGSAEVEVEGKCLPPLSFSCLLFPCYLGIFIYINQYLQKVFYFTWTITREKWGTKTERTMMRLPRDLRAFYYSVL